MRSEPNRNALPPLAHGVSALHGNSSFHYKPRDSAQSQSFSLRVLTLNVWDLAPLAKDIAYRMDEIGKQLAVMNLDLVGLQEAWNEEDRARLWRGAQAGGLQYSHYFPSGIFGSGVWILSRYPIIDAGFYRFRLTGELEKIWNADFYGGKGIGFARVLTPKGPIDVYNTHLVASYADDPFLAERAAGAYECARYTSQSNEYPVIFLGDFNIVPDERSYGIFRALSQMTDVYAFLHPMDSGETISSENPYRGKGTKPVRIDYVFIRNGKSTGLEPSSAEVTMKLLDAPAASPARVAYSDHFGVLVELTVSESISPVTNGPTDANEVKAALLNLETILEEGLAGAESRQTATRLRTVAGLGSLPLVNFLGGKIQSRRRLLGGALKYTGLVLVAAFAAFEAGLSLYQLPDDIHARQAILSEIQRQLDARRAFNGVSW